ncbi:DNA repair protein, partial [Salmonella enterica subsp. enterica serovar Typhimurium]|nr:DNA repair protein [Salmonella enterica subsp. enterica serovar Typhimurium]ECP4831014.1 DNA repair protein [Salmonella enterica subsp. enterica serovar Typhimurium]EEL7258045.1 DNA repair protein [Salmonella enterica subsp. enterica serovar Typhimurium]
MSTPIKRLEIIKNAIELEDDDIIQSQLVRLKSEAFDDELLIIVAALEAKNYTTAMA